MPFIWIHDPQLPVAEPPIIIPSDAVSSKVDPVANTVNVGGSLRYNTISRGYDVVYPTVTSNVVSVNISTFDTLNTTFMNATQAIIGTMSINEGNITTAYVNSIVAPSANITFLYNTKVVNGTVSGDPTVPLGIASKQYVDNIPVVVGGVSANTGQISTFATPNLPTGWVESGPLSISRTEYANLYSTLGTRYGSGDGSTTFGVPCIYAPIEGGMLATGNTSLVRWGGTITRLSNTTAVVLVGGVDAVPMANAYIGTVNVNTITWTQTNDLPSPRYVHGTCELNDGRLLVVGGYDSAPRSNAYLGTVNVNTATISWVTTTNLPVIRYGLSLTKLTDGRVLVVGGNDGVARGNTYLGTIAGNVITWMESTHLVQSSAAALPVVRFYHGASLLLDGRVMIVAGNEYGVKSDVYIGTITSNYISWAQTTPLPVISQNMTQTTLRDGRVLVVGGNDGTSVRYTAYVGTVSGSYVLWEEVIPLPDSRWAHSATLLADGRVMIYGGAANVSTTSRYGTSFFFRLPRIGIKT